MMSIGQKMNGDIAEQDFLSAYHFKQKLHNQTQSNTHTLIT